MFAIPKFFVTKTKPKSNINGLNKNSSTVWEKRVLLKSISVTEFQNRVAFTSKSFQSRNKILKYSNSRYAKMKTLISNVDRFLQNIVISDYQYVMKVALIWVVSVNFHAIVTFQLGLKHLIHFRFFANFLNFRFNLMECLKAWLIE